MSTPLSLVCRQARVQAVAAFLDANAGGAVRFYSGSTPATPDIAATGALLANIPLAVPCATVGNAAGAATLTFTPRVGVVVATGTIGYARMVDGAGNAAMDLDVGLVASGMAVELSSLQVYAGAELQLLSCVLSE